MRQNITAASLALALKSISGSVGHLFGSLLIITTALTGCTDSGELRDKNSISNPDTLFFMAKFEANQPIVFVSQLSELCITVGSNSSSAGLIQQNCDSSARQEFTAVPTDGGRYLIQTSTGQCFDFGTSSTGGKQVMARDCDSRASQKWSFIEESDGSYRIQTSDGQGCLDVYRESRSPGEIIDTYRCKSSYENTNQRFRLNTIVQQPPAEEPEAPQEPETPSSPTTSIIADTSQPCLAVDSHSAGAGVRQQNCNGSDLQSFSVRPTADGFYRIETAAGHCLDFGASSTSGRQVTARNCTNEPNQKWSLHFTDSSGQNGTYIIRTSDGAGCLDVYRESVTPGEIIDTYRCKPDYENSNQRFQMNLDEEPEEPEPPQPTPIPTPPPSNRPPGGGDGSRQFLIVTAGQSNAGFRIDDGGLLRDSGWDWPLWSVQSDFLKKALGIAAADDSGDRYGGDIETAVGGCGLMRSLGDCHFVDDSRSTNPANWSLSGVGTTLANNIRKNKNNYEVVFVSWIQGEADAHAIPHTDSSGIYGFDSQEEWAEHYKDVLIQLIYKLREQTGVPQLRMAVQLIGNYGGATDLIRQAQLDAAKQSKGAIIIANANPWQCYRPNGDDWSHYSGQTYMDLTLEGSRVMGYALAQSGYFGTESGPSYGRFPEVTSVSISGNTVTLRVSNPNGATSLILPSSNPTQGWTVRDNGQRVGINQISVSNGFNLVLTLDRNISSNAVVTYGTEGNRPNAGQAITDNAASTAPPEPAGLERRNMPLAVKPR